MAASVNAERVTDLFVRRRGELVCLGAIIDKGVSG